MTERDYQLIADAAKLVIGSYHPWAISNVTRETIEAIADALGRDNPSFDRAKFLQDCVVEAA